MSILNNLFDIYDIFQSINNFIDISDIINLRLVNKQINLFYNSLELKKLYFNHCYKNLNVYYLSLFKKRNEVIEIYKLSSYFNPIKYIPSNFKYCINQDCSNHHIQRNRNLSWTCFYYPKNLTEPHDHENDPYGVNYAGGIRAKECYLCEFKNIKCQFIPYCYNCMNKYVNGYREDGLETPYQSYFYTNIY